MKVKDALEMENLVEGLSVGPVRVTRLFARKAGEGEKGPWSFEDIGVEEDGKLYAIKLKGCKPGVEYGLQPGVMATFRSQQGSKGTHGVKLVDDEYNGQTTRKLVCTPRVLIEIGGARPSAPEAPQAEPNGDFDKLSHSPPTGGENLDRMGRMMSACIVKAEEVLRCRYAPLGELPEGFPSEDQRHTNERVLAIATTFFIQSKQKP